MCKGHCRRSANPRLGATLLVATLIAGSQAIAQTKDLVVTVTGTVMSDFDMSGVFGFGVSPVNDVSTAAGQPVSMTFVLNLNEIPPNVCADNACFSANRAYYFANTLPATDWITTSESIAGKSLPNLTPHGGNSAPSEAFAQLWNSFSPDYEVDIESTQVGYSQTNISPGVYTFSTATEDMFLRADSITTPFLNGLSLDQAFTWNPSENDGLSIATISLALGGGECVNTKCQSSQTIDGFATIAVDSVTGKVVTVREPVTLSMLAAGLLLLSLSMRVVRQAEIKAFGWMTAVVGRWILH